MDYQQKLDQYKKDIESRKIRKAKLEQQMEYLKEEKEKLLKELQQYGIKEKDLNITVADLEIEIKQSLEKIQKELK